MFCAIYFRVATTNQLQNEEKFTGSSTNLKLLSFVECGMVIFLCFQDAEWPSSYVIQVQAARAVDRSDSVDGGSHDVSETTCLVTELFSYNDGLEEFFILELSLLEEKVNKTCSQSYYVLLGIDFVDMNCLAGPSKGAVDGTYLKEIKWAALVIREPGDAASHVATNPSASGSNVNNNNNSGTPDPYPRHHPDYLVPITNILCIMKRILPPNAKVSEEVKTTIQECLSEYTHFITGEANERCHCEQRKTITAEDLLYAYARLGFRNYCWKNGYIHCRVNEKICSHNGTLERIQDNYLSFIHVYRIHVY
ncbi:unnamed protein product [Coffea canephora]|uniref:Transcription factor CBF/NF-Y/archaeal histone domain-containing protein n=1 Tax=Coffea canephora TaxID=49390 RepID=A0A068V678_COFCA|nr:unnamed protein product [Coffea canephora]